MRVLVAAVAAWSALAGARTDDARTIKESRAASNAGIAARDVAAATALMADEVRVIASGGSLIDGVAAMRGAFARTFADAAFVTYVRTPSRIVVAGAVAAEHGRWTGVWRDRRLAGDYLARWERRPAGWRITAEIYVPTDPVARR